MRETIEKLWDEYFAEKCAVINTEEERTLVKKTVKMQKPINETLTKDQRKIVQEYIDAIYELQGFSVKKAFFYGCEFATSFFFENLKI